MGHTLAVVVYVCLTLVLTWPLASNPGGLVPHDPGDPLLSTWTLWWNAQVLPFTEAWWHGPIFYPARDALTYSDHRVGLGLIATPIMWLGGSPLLAHNVAFLASFVLSAVAAYALCWTLTHHRGAAFLGGLIFGFHPFRAEHLPHLELLASYWLPVVLLALHRWSATAEARAAATGVAPRTTQVVSGTTADAATAASGSLSAGAWLVVLSGALLAQALTCGYYFVFAGVLFGLWLVWFLPRRLPMRDYAALGVALVLPLIVIAPALLRYRTAHQEVGLSRSLTEIDGFSADVLGFVTAPALLAVWNTPAAWQKPEGALFPGVTAVFLVIAALLWRRGGPRGRSIEQTGVDDESRTWIWMRRALLIGAIAGASLAAWAALAGPSAIRLGGGGLRISLSQPFKPLSVATLLATIWLLTSARVRDAWRRRSPFAFYTLATIALWIFALGPTARFMGHRLLYKAPYAWLMVLPGFRDEFRVPARYAMLAALTLGVAAAFAVVRLLGTRAPRVQLAACSFLALGVTADGWFAPFPTHPAPRPLDLPATVPRDALIVELPIGDYEDGAAMYRAITHGHRILNGMSGYEPPHMAVLKRAIAEGHLETLATFTTDADLVIVIPKTGPAAAYARLVPTHTAATHIADTSEHELWLLRRSQQPHSGNPGGLNGNGSGVHGGNGGSATPALARRLPIARIHSASTMVRAEEMHDDRRTAWTTDQPVQRGDEYVVADLGGRHDVAGIAIGPGAQPGAYPRALAIELSDDLQTWREVWRGDTAARSLAAFLEDPLYGMMTIDFAPGPARYVRLSQVGQTRHDGWVIAELRVMGSR